MQPKKQLKVQCIGIFEEIDSFYWPRMHFPFECAWYVETIENICIEFN